MLKMELLTNSQVIEQQERRIADLIEANNREVDKRRAAESLAADAKIIADHWQSMWLEAVRLNRAPELKP